MVPTLASSNSSTAVVIVVTVRLIGSRGCLRRRSKDWRSSPDEVVAEEVD